MIAIDMQPVTIVEDTGFQSLVRLLDSRYQLITKKITRLRTLRAASFQKIAEEWGISRKVVAMVTDNAAVRHTVWTHVSCFAHTLNLVVSEAIKADKKIHQLKLIGEDTRNCFPIAIQCYTN